MRRIHATVRSKYHAEQSGNQLREPFLFLEECAALIFFALRWRVILRGEVFLTDARLAEECLPERATAGGRAVERRGCVMTGAVFSEDDAEASCGACAGMEPLGGFMLASRACREALREQRSITTGSPVWTREKAS